MGFRLYVTQNGHEFCMGKLYGYTDKHLYSLDYLISLGYFEEELEPFKAFANGLPVKLSWE